MLDKLFNLPLKIKLLTLTAITLLIFLIGNVFVADRANSIAAELSAFESTHIKASQKITDIIRDKTNQQLLFERAVRLVLQQESGQNVSGQLNKTVKQYEELGFELSGQFNEITALIENGRGQVEGVDAASVDKLLDTLKASEARHASNQKAVDDFISEMLRNNGVQNISQLDDIESRTLESQSQLQALSDNINTYLGTALSRVSEHEEGIVSTLFITFVISAILSGLLAIMVSGRISQQLRLVVGYADTLATGNFDIKFADGDKDEAGQIIEALKKMRDQVFAKLNADRAEAMRIKNALDVANTNVMLADEGFNIIYMNNSVKEMMQVAESDLKKDLPNFDARNLVGKNIDTFHKNPAHQRNMLEKLTDTYFGQITVGGRTFGLIANPIFDDDHKRVGTVVEWDDKTAQLAADKARQELENDNARVKQALDVCDTNVMMADADYNIIYMNQAVQRMMKTAEADLKTELTNFDASNMMGKNIDIFHKNPAHQRSMLDKLKDVYRTDIKVGGRTFGLIATPIMDNNGNRLATVVEWDDKTQRLAEEKQKEEMAASSLRIKQALDNVTTNVMVADAGRNIIYANQAVTDMLRNAQSDLRKELPQFNVDTMVGTNIDQFHKNPAHQMGMLDRLTGTHRTKIVVGGRHMHLTVNPIIDDQGKRLGTVVEWADLTIEVQIQNEIDNIIAAANDGDLSARIPMEGKTGFFEKVGSGLNTLLDKTASFVADIGDVFGAMAEGNLTKNINKDYRGQFEEIKNNANNTVMKMNEVLLKIQNASNTVRTSANEVAQGSDDLSRRTESQASSLEETASSMEEITATVKQTSENATEANSLAAEAKGKAQEGGDVVSNAVEAMSEILESSNKINDIIGVIDEIAFQTNLLALNAAVEAARAGEQGRGFAVVAGEVRTLSQRSAAAAKEIKDLIRDSVNKVESGSKLVNQSGQMLADIVSAVERVAVMINDVNNASIEQNSGIGQINQAITQMDEMTQQNAALVEETSAASRSMSEEANNMNNLISFFSLGNQQRSFQSSNEPVMTYKAAEKPASSSNKSSGNRGAASFSEDDEWEDF